MEEDGRRSIREKVDFFFLIRTLEMSFSRRASTRATGTRIIVRIVRELVPTAVKLLSGPRVLPPRIFYRNLNLPCKPPCTGKEPSAPTSGRYLHIVKNIYL